jgi:multicomponent Na+:H+ antiporter subunit B
MSQNDGRDPNEPALAKSVFFRSVTKILVPMAFLLAGFLFLRGHNAPGGGFIAGLLAAISIVVVALAYDVARALKTYRVRTFSLVAVGLGVAASSGLIAIFAKPAGLYFEGFWVGPLGTPVLFDFGVFLVVFGVVVNFVLSVMED